MLLPSKGWIATRINVYGYHAEGRGALTNQVKSQQAEDEILVWFQEDTINLLAVMRTKRFNKAGNRWHQLREALQLTLRGAILVRGAADSGSHATASPRTFWVPARSRRDADLTVFDSITGHPNSLPSLIKQLTKGVRKSSDKQLTFAATTWHSPRSVSGLRQPCRVHEGMAFDDSAC